MQPKVCPNRLLYLYNAPKTLIMSLTNLILSKNECHSNWCSPCNVCLKNKKDVCLQLMQFHCCYNDDNNNMQFNYFPNYYFPLLQNGFSSMQATQSVEGKYLVYFPCLDALGYIHAQ